MSMIRIAMDAMGGDNAPLSVVEGAYRALEAEKDIEITLYGSEEAVRPLLTKQNERLHFVATTEVIGMDEAPVMAVRKKADSSLVRAFLSVKNGEADAAVSAGSTGALLAGGMMRVGRIPGIERPSLAPVLPGKNGRFLVIDAGANVDCQPKYLMQFGLMGSVYMKSVLGIEDPKVALLNIGAEAEKGNALTKQAYEMMSKQNVYNFTGNVEARDVPQGDVDVVVTDGFDGNLILKYTEGLSQTLFSMIKEVLMSGVRTKIGALLVKPALSGFKKKLDYREVGGAPLLGCVGAIVKAHGSSNATAMKNAILQARLMVAGGVVEKIKDGLKAISFEE